MPTLLDIPDIIDIGDASVYLSGNYKAKKEAGFGGTILKKSSPEYIAMVTDGLRWGYDGGAQSVDSLRNVGNFLYWLCGKFGLEAQNIISGPGGGSITQITQSSIFPIVVTGADFEADGITYNNPDIVGENLMLFVASFNQEWQFAPVFFSYTPTGIQIVFPGFDANNYDYIIIQNFNP